MAYRVAPNSDAAASPEKSLFVLAVYFTAGGHVRFVARRVIEENTVHALLSLRGTNNPG